MMAQARTTGSGGFTTVHVWMIGFVFLWLTSTVLLVWLYTEQEDLKTAAIQLREENRRLAGSSDKNLPWYAQSSSSGPTMVGLIEQQRSETAKIAVGHEVGDVQTVLSEIEAFFKRIREDGLLEETAAFETPQLLPAMTYLYEAFVGRDTLAKNALSRAEEADAKLNDALATLESVQSEFAKATAEQKERIDALEKERADYYARRDKEVEDFNARLDNLRQEHSRKVQAKNNEIRELQSKFAELQDRYGELTAKLGELQIKPGKRLTLRVADGAIVKAIPGDEVVYVNLGRRQHLTPGLQFAVYPSSGIPPDGQSKGRIEVTKIHETTSECRILSVDPREILLEGDLLANPVFDPARSLRFVVVGRFDVDGDGHEEPDGAERIKAIITGWGGQVVEGVSSRVDFVVAGYAPVIPTLVASGSAAADRGAQERERLLRKERDEYEQVVAAAHNLSVPILSQEVFVRFLGF